MDMDIVTKYSKEFDKNWEEKMMKQDKKMLVSIIKEQCIKSFRLKCILDDISKSHIV